MSLTGEPDGPPTKSGLSLVDMATGYAAALALMSGLWAARRDGIGCDCDISLFETAMNLNMYVSTWHLSKGWVPERTHNSAHPSIVPFQNFATRDGWIVIACAKDKFFDLLCGVLGLEWMTSDARFATMAARRSNRDACLAELAAVLLGDDATTWIERLRAAGVPCGPVNDMAGAVSDPQTLARDLIAETEHPVLGTVRQIRSPLRVDGRADRAARGTASRRAHTRGADRPLRLRGRRGRPARGRRRLRRRRGVAGRLELTAPSGLSGNDPAAYESPWTPGRHPGRQPADVGAASGATVSGASAAGRLTITMPAITTAMPTVAHAPGRLPRAASITSATTGERNAHG